MMDALLQLDHSLFLAIHLGLACDLLDFLLPLFRNKLFWAPLYVYLLAAVWYQHRKVFWGFILAVAMLVTVSDTLSSKVVKPVVERLRPCRTPGLMEEVRPLVGCGGGYSFTSSHATNHFALAVFLMGTFSRKRKKTRWLWLLWAGVISISQIYVGVHFPLDILGGTLLGCLVGWGILRLYLDISIYYGQLHL